MSYEVKTPIFEGPLDLLLQLITSHRLEVTELRLSDLVSAYLDHLDLMREMDLEVTSEFLVIAATLIQLKARSLLPDAREVDLDEDLLLSEERDRLLSRLLANLTFKDVAAVFGHRFESTTLFVPREIGLEDDITPPPADVRIGASPLDLARLATRLLTVPVPSLDHLELDLPSVSDAIADLRRRLDAEIETDFDRITSHLDRPVELVAYFLAMLELARWGMLEARQESPDLPIRLKRTAGGAGRLISEWEIA